MKYRFPEIVINKLFADSSPSFLCGWQIYTGDDGHSLEVIAERLCGYHAVHIMDALGVAHLSSKVMVEIQDDRSVLHTFVCQLEYKAKRINV